MSDISHWFSRRRGIAVALVSCGNYLAGTLWPPVIQHFIAAQGWRTTQIAIGVLCVAAMLPLVLLLRRPAPRHAPGGHGATSGSGPSSFGLSPNALMVLLCIAGVGCCVAMSMPQVHIVAYCGDLGYGPARGAEMLAAMMVSASSAVSRQASSPTASEVWKRCSWAPSCKPSRCFSICGSTASFRSI